MPSAYLVNTGSNNVSVIDTGTFTVVGTVTVGTSPRGAAVTPNLAFVYVTNFTSNNVSVINATSMTVVATITVGTGPGGICMSADGTTVLVANSTSGTVSVISTASNTVTGTVTLPIHPPGSGSAPFSVCISPDSTTGYVSTKSTGGSSTQWVEVINIAGLSITTSINIISSTNADTTTCIQGICAAPNGLHVFVTGSLSGTQAVIATATNTVIATMTDLTGEPRSICVLPDGSKGFWNNSTGDLYEFNPTAFTVTTHITLIGGDALTGIAPSSDSTTVYVGDTGSGHTSSTIWKVLTSTLAKTSLATGQSTADGIGLSLYAALEQIVMII